jgi:hypothetical protein
LSAKAWTPILGRLTTISANNYPYAACNRSTAAISTSSPVGSASASALPSDDESSTLNYATSAPSSAATIGFQFFIFLAEEILHGSQPIKEGLYKRN